MDLLFFAVFLFGGFIFYWLGSAYENKLFAFAAGAVFIVLGWTVISTAVTYSFIPANTTTTYSPNYFVFSNSSCSDPNAGCCSENTTVTGNFTEAVSYKTVSTNSTETWALGILLVLIGLYTVLSLFIGEKTSG